MNLLPPNLPFKSKREWMRVYTCHSCDALLSTHGNSQRSLRIRWAVNLQNVTHSHWCKGNGHGCSHPTVMVLCFALEAPVCIQLAITLPNMTHSRKLWKAGNPQQPYIIDMVVAHWSCNCGVKKGSGRHQITSSLPVTRLWNVTWMWVAFQWCGSWVTRLKLAWRG